MSFSILLAVLLPISLVSASANNIARLVPQHRDATYNGGWALGLPSVGCPGDAPVACPAGDVNPTCCPFGQTCFGFLQPYCCPTDADCTNVVNNLPVCANSTWTMWQLSSDGYVCCEPDQIGMNPVSGYAGICQPKDQPIISSLIATLASQIGGPPITTGPGGGAATATATTTKDSNNAKTTTTTSTATGSQTSASSDSSVGESVWKKIHMSLGEVIGIAIGGLIVISAIVLAIWCCCRRKRRNRTQATYVEPYRNQGVSSYIPTPTTYNAGYGGYGGQRGLDTESDGVPLTNVGYVQEYKAPPVSHSELGAENVFDERR